MMLLIVIALPFGVQAQEIDSIEFEFLPKSLRIGVDLMGMGKSIAKDDLTHYEITGDLLIHKYLLNFDYGIEERARISDGATYDMKGTFYRVGIDVNMMPIEDKASVIFFGLRYGKANFDNSLVYTTTDDLFGSGNDSRKTTDINAQWYELTGGTKVKIWKPLWLGFTFRFKFSMKHDDSLQLIPHDIPGYGKADEKNYWGFNYYLFYKIPFGKKKGL